MRRRCIGAFFWSSMARVSLPLEEPSNEFCESTSRHRFIPVMGIGRRCRLRVAFSSGRRVWARPFGHGSARCAHRTRLCGFAPCGRRTSRSAAEPVRTGGRRDGGNAAWPAGRRIRTRPLAGSVVCITRTAHYTGRAHRAENERCPQNSAATRKGWHQNFGSPARRLAAAEAVPDATRDLPGADLRHRNEGDRP